MKTVTLAENEVLVERAKLRLWLQLSEVRESIEEAVGKRDFTGVADLLVQYVSTASSVDCSEAPWYQVAEAFVEYQNVNAQTLRIPMTQLDTVSKKPPEQVPWDYRGRLWYMWSDMLASRYGWTLEYIADLNVDDALALIQEIIVDDQMQKEWEWQRSEVAYEYVKSSGSSRLRPLPRPDWMLPQRKHLKVKTTKIPMSVLPVGNIENMSGMGLHGRIDSSLN